MADFTSQDANFTPTPLTASDPDPRPSGFVFFYQTLLNPQTFIFKMRALASPGPGFVVWAVTGAPDFAGTFAPSPIVPGSAVHVSTWAQP